MITISFILAALVLFISWDASASEASNEPVPVRAKNVVPRSDTVAHRNIGL